jgi:hypothetical protein
MSKLDYLCDFCQKRFGFAATIYTDNYDFYMNICEVCLPKYEKGELQRPPDRLRKCKEIPEEVLLGIKNGKRSKNR